MGPLSSETAACADKVLKALEEKRSGNPLSYLRLEHAISSKSPTASAEVLAGLTHFVASLHTGSPYVSDLRKLISSALSMDLLVCATPTDNGEFPTLEAFHIFIINLVSADASFVEPVLDMLARKAFVALPDRRRSPVLKYAYATVASVLDAYPRADALLAAVISARYPHPVRPAAEHVAYLRSVLHVSRECNSVELSRSIISTVFEKLGAIEALVPRDIFHGNDSTEGVFLTPEAEKVELILVELFRHVDLAKRDTASFAARHFEHMFAAYEASIVPIEGARFAPYVLLYASSAGGEPAVLEVIKRMRQSFFDPSVSQRLREKFLEHSCGVVIRASLCGPGAALRWMVSIAEWLNRYIDAQERRSGCVAQDIDIDVHHLFYSACCALMTGVSKRRDAISTPMPFANDPADHMRLYRIMSCTMNPMLVLPGEIVREFVDVVREASGLDFADIIDENKGKFTPSRTKYGSRNKFEHDVRCWELELPNARLKLVDVMRSDTQEVDDPGAQDIPVTPAKTLSTAVEPAETTPSRILSTTFA